jgi:hypothetical protein
MLLRVTAAPGGLPVQRLLRQAQGFGFEGESRASTGTGSRAAALSIGISSMQLKYRSRWALREACGSDCAGGSQ